MQMKISAFGHFIEKLVELLFCCLILKVFEPVSRYNTRQRKQEQGYDNKINIQLAISTQVTAPQGYKRQLDTDCIRSSPMRASTIIELELPHKNQDSAYE